MSGRADSVSHLIFYCQTEVDPLARQRAMKKASQEAAALQSVGGADGDEAKMKDVSEEEAKGDGDDTNAAAAVTSSLAGESAVDVEIEPILRLKIASDSLPEDATDLRSVYFVRSSDTPLRIARDVDAHCDSGILTGDSLLNLSEVLNNVFLPLLDAADDAEDTSGLDVSESTLRNEFRNSLQKFSSQVSHAIQQVSGDIHLQIPDITIDDPGATTEDYETVQMLENALEDWTRAITNVVEQETKKKPQGTGPLAEIEFWRVRNATLSAMYEQINMPQVQKMIHVLDLVESNGMPTFKFQYPILHKHYVEAKDNVKFLATLERHFKNISNGNLSQIQDTLESMMNAIRMVWIISRHYNTDERMVPLMERIANEIADKVAREISIPEILHKDSEVALRTIDEAVRVLESWSETYHKVGSLL